MTPELWHFSISLVKHPDGFSLVRFTSRDGQPKHAGKPFQDLDISGKASVQLQRPDLLPKAITLVRLLGFKFPLPINCAAALKIFSFQAFPAFATWEKLSVEGYTEDHYREDRNLWMRQKLTLKGYPELWQRLAGFMLWMRSPHDKAEKARRAMQVEWFFALHRDRLQEYYGKVAVPPRAEEYLKELAFYSEQHAPVRKKATKKEAKSAATGGGGKRKAQADQMGLEW